MSRTTRPMQRSRAAGASNSTALRTEICPVAHHCPPLLDHCASRISPLGALAYDVMQRDLSEVRVEVSFVSDPVSKRRAETVHGQITIRPKFSKQLLH